MKAVLIVSRDNKQTAKAIIDRPEFIIGRSVKCGLVLDDVDVSREHVIVKKTADGKIALCDQGSRNGTIVNGQPITKDTELASGSNFKIGPFEILLMLSDSEEDDGVQLTQAFDPRMTATSKGANSAADNSGDQPDWIKAKLVCSAGLLRGNTFKDWSDKLTLGRSMDNDVIIQDEALSGEHCKIVYENGAFYLEDLKSLNGTFLRGVKIRKEPLGSGAQIRLGASAFQFTFVDVKKSKKMKALSAALILLIIGLSLTAKFLMPEPAHFQVIRDGYALINTEKYDDARGQFEKALQMNPGNLEATRGVKKAHELSEASKLSAYALTAANEENYQLALDYVYQILRISPNDKEAKELESVLKSVEEAEIAVGAQNWETAINLLNKARGNYPDSKVIINLSEKAELESSLKDRLEKAREMRSIRDYKAGLATLKDFPKESVYYSDASTLLQLLTDESFLSTGLETSLVSYRAGHVSEALGHISRGLTLDPENEQLEALQKKILKVSALQADLAKQQEATNEGIVEGRKTLALAQLVIRAEADDQNVIHQKALKLVTEIEGKIKVLVNASMKIAGAAIAAGDERAAAVAYRQVLEADPEQLEAKAAYGRIVKEANERCKKLFGSGAVQEELGQYELALEYYTQVLDVAIPDSEYYRKAELKLKRLKH